ncbi:hypothetical protein [Chryseobacterium lactis]|nr:hypothetical protein [Chryseobacterium lactis]
MKNEFLPLESKPWWIMTWLIRIFTPAFLLAILLAFLIFPFLLTGHKVFFPILAIFYYPTLIYIVYRLFRHGKKAFKERVTKVLVDDKGLHYYKIDGSTEEILYSQIQGWALNDVYDVGVSQKVKTWFIKVRYDDDVIEVNFDMIDPGFTYYAGNTRALRRKFVQGIVYFRPDLRIDPFIFDAFYINPENFRFNAMQYWKSILGTVAVMLVLGTALAFFMLWLVR